MSKLKILSGFDVVKVFGKFGFSIVVQKGSHIKLRRIIDNGIKQTLTIPKHKELSKGTLQSIYNQGLRYTPEMDLNKYFFN